MAEIQITAEDIAEILEKKYNIQNPFKSIDGLTKEDINNIIIETEISKFNKTFNTIFEENLLSEEEGEDSEDGAINEIGIKVIESIKESFQKIDKEKLLKLLFKLITKLVFGNNEED